MTADDGLEFGEVRESAPERRRRPDQDRHYAVVEVGRVGEDDLPIFVQLDAWRQLLEHAREDMTVELGGVLLGGAFLDGDGRPFVLVQDALRAEHYEATRGSFKFTHDTWESITRRRDEYGGDSAMTGWYHTHPDWGVFLSSMDLFICEHFFAKPLDVALVLDPCREDWGWFQWTGRAGAAPRRVGGFFLVAAPNRADELSAAAAACIATGDRSMTAESRWSQVRSAAPSGAGAPVVHVHAPSQGLAQQAPIVALLIVQTLLVALLAWRSFSSDGGTRGRAADVAAAPSGRERELERTRARDEARTELMNQVLEDLAAAPGGAFTQLTELQERNDELTSSLRAQQARERELTAENEKRVAEEARLRKRLEGQVAALTSREAELRDELAVVRRRLDAVAKTDDRADAEGKTSTDENGAAQGETGEGETAEDKRPRTAQILIGAIAAVVLGATAAVWRLQLKRRAAGEGG